MTDCEHCGHELDNHYLHLWGVDKKTITALCRVDGCYCNGVVRYGVKLVKKETLIRYCPTEGCGPDSVYVETELTHITLGHRIPIYACKKCGSEY